MRVKYTEILKKFNNVTVRAPKGFMVIASPIASVKPRYVSERYYKEKHAKK